MKKKLLTLVLALAAAIPASAQWDLGYFDIRAGYRGYLGSDCYGTSLNGAYIGTNFCFDDLMGPIDLGIGVNFSQAYKSKVQSSFPGFTETLSMVIRDMQFPLFIRARFPIGDSELYLKFGPTFNCGLTMDVRDHDQWTHSDQRYNFYQDTDKWIYSRFDVMLDSGIGFIFGERFAIQVAYAWGCLPRCTQDYYIDESGRGVVVPGGDPKSHNMELNVGLSYAFK